MRAATVVERLRQRADSGGEETALRFLTNGDDAEEVLSAGQFDLAARRIAAALSQFIKPGERAVLLMPSGLDFLRVFAGALYAGVIVVPAYPPAGSRLEVAAQRLQALVADSRATGIVAGPEVMSRRPVLEEHAPGLRQITWLAYDQLSAGSGDYVAPDVRAESIAFLQYTSGSTARPKGVMVSHGNLIDTIALIAEKMDLTRGSSVVSWLPLFHDMGLIGCALTPLLVGFPVTLMSPAHFVQRPLRWLHAVSKYRATTTGAPNFALEMCTRAASEVELGQLDLSSLRVLFVGAEPVRRETLLNFASRFAPAKFAERALYPTYGLAEATLMVSGKRHSEPARAWSLDGAALSRGTITDAQPGVGTNSIVSCGPWHPSHLVRVVDPESRSECAPGTVGEIWVHGPSVAQGYWDKPELTTAVFRAQILGEERPYLRTGDLGFIRDGELAITGRLKDVLVVRGRKLYPQDLELALERCVPGLQPGAIAVVGYKAHGEDHIVVVAEASRRADIAHERTIEAARQLVAEEAQAPAEAVLLIRPRTLPLTSSGKIRRAACLEQVLNGSHAVLAQWRSPRLLDSVAQRASAEPFGRT